MLRRQSSKSKPDLNRRKSTSSVHGVHLEHIDPAVAQRDAHAAACQAFSRAQARDRVEMPLFPPTPDSSPRRRYYANGGSDGPGGETPTGPTTANLQELRRRQSVRFMGPCSSHAMKSRNAETGSMQGSRDEETDPARLRDDYERTPQTYVAGTHIGPQQLKVVGIPHREPPPVPLPGIASDYLVALVAGEEYYTPEDNIASAPSSYRRLRRSRSMFTSEGVSTGGGLPPTGTSLNGRVARGARGTTAMSPRGPALSDQDGRLPSQNTPQLRAPKSMSFLRNRSRRSGSVTTQGTRDGDFQTPSAAGQSGHRFRNASQETPRLASKSSFFSSRSKRTEPVLRKSLRSNGSTDEPETSSGQPTTAPGPSDKEDRFKVKARKVSKSLKAKLKTLFNLTKSEEEPPSFPPQHITAQRTHVIEGFLSPVSANLEQDFKNKIEWSSIHRVPSGVPSLQKVPSNLVRSTRGSLESLKSGVERKVSDDKSLTSWAGSGPSTLTSQQQQEWREWERQRLSIINENGAHAPTSSFQRKALGTHILQNDNAPFGNPVPPVPIVDSQRVYSALMRRVRESNSQADESGNQPPYSSVALQGATNNTRSLESLRQESIKALNIGSKGQLNYQKSTSPTDLATPTRVSKRGGLRLVRPGTDAGQFRTGSPSPMNVFCNDQKLLKQAERKHLGESNPERFALSSTATTSPAVNLSDPFVDDRSRSSKMAHCGYDDEESNPRSPHEPESNNTPTSHLFRTKPPYRQTLRKSMEAEQLLNGHQASLRFSSLGSEEDHVEKITNDILTTIDADRFNHTQYSESVYSTDEYPQDTREQDLERPGLRLQRVGSSPIYRRPADYRDHSSASSIDWKTWLSANIEKFESSPTPPLPSEVEYALPTMPKSFQSGHVRELAQTHDEDEDVQIFESPTHKATLPIAPLATVEPNVMKLSPRQRSIKRTSPPSTGKMLLENDSPRDTPSMGVKDSVRAVPSPLKRASTHIGYSLPSSVASSPGLSTALQRQFGYFPKQCETGRSGLSREGKLRMVENVENNVQQSAGNQDESRVFL